MASSKTAYLIIDAGGTFLKSAILDSHGIVLKGSALSEKSFSEGSKEDILQAFIRIISKGMKFIEQNSLTLKGVGIAFPGPFDIKKATPLMEHKFQAIYGLDLREYFYGITGLPREIPIKFIHDANAVLAGEIWKGYAQGFGNAAVVTLGTGLGFAISKNGEVLCNEIGGPYLSIFKMPYRDGILEDYTAKRGFWKIYSELSGKSFPGEFSVEAIAALADEGDFAAIETFKKVGEFLAEALRNILKEYNIGCLLFSGQISKSFHYMETPLKEGLNGVTSLKKIAAVKNIETAALLGAYKKIFEKKNNSIWKIKNYH